MSLCSLLVESIQSCREGLPTTYGPELRWLERHNPPSQFKIPDDERKNGETVFVGFFKDFADLFPNVSGREFYRSIRNGLLHQAQTKNGWTIKDVWGESLELRRKNH